MDDIQRMQIRVPRTLRNWLKLKAKNSSRSMNGEIVEMMKKEKEKQEKQIIT